MKRIARLFLAIMFIVFGGAGTVTFFVNAKSFTDIANMGACLIAVIVGCFVLPQRANARRKVVKSTMLFILALSAIGCGKPNVLRSGNPNYKGMPLHSVRLEITIQPVMDRIVDQGPTLSDLLVYIRWPDRSPRRMTKKGLLDSTPSFICKTDNCFYKETRENDELYTFHAGDTIYLQITKGLSLNCNLVEHDLVIQPGIGIAEISVPGKGNVKAAITAN